MNKLHIASSVNSHYATTTAASLLLLFLLSGAASAITATFNGSIAECSELETELVFDSDAVMSKRFMEEKKYISPGALKRNQPTCGGGERGEAYSKSGGCGLPDQSNPQTPGCFKYYRCRSST
ncbi:hypothetical protein SAY86_012121 [Trapa natans]|uniref:Rapid ALkalinization Factor n=1 Tax=Trapa natans TaxID=22666 RepID=A0AAN7LWZ4_TRANT|nr:hypothetical protein SAY86_012121 [Trapa natans]